MDDKLAQLLADMLGIGFDEALEFIVSDEGKTVRPALVALTAQTQTPATQTQTGQTAQTPATVKGFQDYLSGAQRLTEEKHTSEMAKAQVELAQALWDLNNAPNKEAREQAQQAVAIAQYNMNVAQYQIQQDQYRSNVAQSLLQTAASLQGPENYFKFMQFVSGGRAIADLMTGEPRQQFGGVSGTSEPMTVGGLLGKMGITQAEQLFPPVQTLPTLALPTPSTGSAPGGAVSAPVAQGIPTTMQAAQAQPQAQAQLINNASDAIGSDGAVYSQQSPETIAAFEATYGNQAPQFWLNEHEASIATTPGARATPVKAAAPAAITPQSVQQQIELPQLQPSSAFAVHEGRTFEGNLRDPSTFDALKGWSDRDKKISGFYGMPMQFDPDNPIHQAIVEAPGPSGTDWSGATAYLNQKAGAPWQINPVNWDALGPVGQGLKLGFAAAAGWDPDEYKRQIDLARPSGKAPKQVNVQWAPAWGAF